MNRRGFLQSLMIGASALAVDPEELLWRPTKTIFIPRRRETRYHVVFGVTLTLRTFYWIAPDGRVWLYEHRYRSAPVITELSQKQVHTLRAPRRLDPLPFAPPLGLLFGP